MSRRTLRIANIVRSVVAEGLQRRLSDPRICPFTSVTRVDVSDDLSVADVHVSVMATGPKKKLCIDGLEAASGRFRGWLGDALSTRTVPSLRFHLDESLQRGMATVQILDELQREREEREAALAGTSADADDDIEADDLDDSDDDDDDHSDEESDEDDSNEGKR